MWTARENFIRNAWLEGHEWIPTHVVISGAYWLEAREEMEALCLRHPVIFPHFRPGMVNYEALRPAVDQHITTDAWGVKWEAQIDGLLGLVIDSPLRDWSNWDKWRPPAPPAFTAAQRQAILDARAQGELTSYDTEHGFFFMRLYYLRGYEPFMEDAASDEPMLGRLVEAVADHWGKAIEPYVAMGIDLLSAADDQGTQSASMLGPTYFRKWLLPTYQRLFLPQRRKGGHVFMHTDGYIMDIMDEIIESGVSIVNPQDLVNGIDAIAKACKGRVCVRIDIDRQKVMPYGSPGDVHQLIQEEVMKLGSPQGGLEMVCGIYPPTPIANIEALCLALEEFRGYWARG